MTEALSIVELLARLDEVDESHEIEAKRAASELGKSARDTISAFANEPGLGGGYLLFGVEEDDASGRFIAKGVAQPKKLEQEISTLCASAFNRTIRPRVWSENVGGVSLVAAFIPEAAASEKPVFETKRGMQAGAYRRIGSTDQRCTEDDLRVLFRAGDSAAYEDTLLRDATEEDLSPETIAAYRRQLLDENPGTELRDATGLELVQAVGGARKDNGRLVPTVAGVLLFGHRLALRRLFPQLRVDYIRITGTRWVPDVDHRYDAIEIRDPLLTAFRRAYQAVLDDLPRSFTLEPGSPERRDRAAVPEKVVREALVNALAHRDYRIASATQVLRYSDRIEIRNPGRALVGEEQFGQPGSFPRNPRIADMFREMRLAENKGTGIEAMRRAMRQADLTPPVFTSDARADRFVTTLWLHSLLDDTELAWLGSFGIDLSAPQRQALVVARRTGSVTNSGLRDLTGLDPLQARRELHTLRDAGLLVMRGERGGAYYVLDAEAAAVDALGSAAPQHGAKPGGSDQTAGLGRESSPDRPGPVADRPGSAADRPGSVADRPELPLEIAAAIARLGARPRQPALRNVIEELCAWRPLTPAAIGELVGIRADNLTKRHLSAMVADGRLERVYPESPSHPEQAYRAVQTKISPKEEP